MDKFIEYPCVGCSSSSHSSPRELKTPWLCRKCRRERDWLIKKLRGNMTRLRLEVIAQRGKKCQECGTIPQKITDLIAHHLTPVTCGGASVPENIKLVCRPCHKQEHKDRHGEQWVGYKLLIAYKNGELSIYLSKEVP